MRRSAGWIIATSVLVALGGAASAAPHPTAVGLTAPRADAAVEKVGTTELVRRSLDYVSSTHSLTLSYPGASYIKVHFSQLALLPGDWLSVSDPAGDQVTQYRFGLSDTWAMSIDGDSAVLTLHGSLARLTGYGMSLDKVAHGFTPTESSRQKGVDRARRDAVVKAMRPGNRTESVCGSNDSLDAVCYKSSDPVAYNNSRPVARLLINGDELCSAFRVGPNDRMLTNHHCIATDTDARNTEVWFNYACMVCGAYVAARPTKVTGDKVIATDQTLDYTLFAVQNFGAIEAFGYLTLDVRDPGAGEQLYIAQHPGGAPTVISMTSDRDRGGNCQVQEPAVDGYGHGTDVSYLCDTAGGSSGSPVLSRVSNRVVALHHFGGCPNSGVRIDLIYPKVASLMG